MKFRCSIWILWTTLACSTAPNVEQTPIPPALSLVLSSTGVYELEDTAALIWRNHDKPLAEQTFYFSYMIFACSELSTGTHEIQSRSTTKSLAFIYQVVEPLIVRNLKTHPLLCQHPKRYHATAVPIIRLENGYAINPELKGNRKRQEFSIGYEIADDCKKLEKECFPQMERFEGLTEGSGWLETFRVIYDTVNLITRQVSYELNFLGKSEEAPGECENFKVGKVQEFFKDISFSIAYRRSAQIGTKGSLFKYKVPERRANVSTEPSTSEQNESYKYKLMEEAVPNSKKPRLIMQPEESSTDEDESFNIDEVDWIHLDAAPWDTGEYSCARSLTDSNTSNTATPSSKTGGESPKSTKRPIPNYVQIHQPANKEYMVMQQLAPIEYFDVFTVQWSTCTYFNVVPMWRSLARGPWKRVDKAIRKMLYVIDKLSIVAGTYGELQLVKQNSSNQYENVFLRSIDKKLTIPKLFYKFVLHKVLIPGLDGASVLYGIIIVMHNDFGVPNNRICPKDPDNLCYRYGWDVGSEDDEIAKPYCCKPSPATLEVLDITSYFSPINDFDLNTVLIEVIGTTKHVVQNYNQFQKKPYKIVAKKKSKRKKLNDSYS